MTKTYARRDSATSALRKIGVQARDYDFFITKKSVNEFECRLSVAQNHLESLKKTVEPATQEVGAEAVKVDIVTPKPEIRIGTIHVSVSQTARSLILEGWTNKEIWEELKSAFNLSDSKKNYPSWYRAEMKRNGAAIS